MSTLTMASSTIKRGHEGYVPEDTDAADNSPDTLMDSPQQTKKCRMMAPPKQYVATTPETDTMPRKRAVPRRPMPDIMRDAPTHMHRHAESDEDEDDDDGGDYGDSDGSEHTMDDAADDARRLRNNRQYSIHQAQFTPQSTAEPVENFIFREVKRKKRNQVKEELASLSSAQPPAVQPAKFTLKQVMSIVDKAVRAREIELQEEFGSILAAKLEEQYHQFTKYTQDFVHQRLQQSQFNYMS